MKTSLPLVTYDAAGGVFRLDGNVLTRVEAFGRWVLRDCAWTALACEEFRRHVRLMMYVEPVIWEGVQP